MYVAGGAAASFEACSFADNVLSAGNGGVSYTTGAGSITWLKNVTFANNTGVDIVTYDEGRVFSSEAGLEYYSHSDYAFPEEAELVPVQTAQTAQFLSFSDPWVLQAAKVRLSPTCTLAPMLEVSSRVSHWLHAW